MTSSIHKVATERLMMINNKRTITKICHSESCVMEASASAIFHLIFSRHRWGGSSLVTAVLVTAELRANTEVHLGETKDAKASKMVSPPGCLFCLFATWSKPEWGR
jgi:hypothetical protein